MPVASSHPIYCLVYTGQPDKKISGELEGSNSKLLLCACQSNSGSPSESKSSQKFRPGTRLRLFFIIVEPESKYQQIHPKESKWQTAHHLGEKNADLRSFLN